MKRPHLSPAVPLLFASIVALGGTAPAGDIFLLPYFLGNDETGIYFAYSRDGLKFQWFNDGKVVLPAPSWGNESLTRDPSIVEGRGHVSHDGILKVIASDDGRQWESVATFKSLRGWDMREAKFSIVPDGRLMMVGCEANRKTKPAHHPSLVWFTADGKRWTRQVPVADPDFWLWRGRWHKGTIPIPRHRKLNSPMAYLFGPKTKPGTKGVQHEKLGLDDRVRHRNDVVPAGLRGRHDDR